MKDLYRIGISGSYGGMNLGDEAILQSMIAHLRAELAVEITVFTREPDDTLGRHRVKRAIPARTLSREEVVPEIERLDLFILGGGGILYDAHVPMYLRESCLRRKATSPSWSMPSAPGRSRNRPRRHWCGTASTMLP